MSEPTPDSGFWRLDHDELSALLARNDLSWETARVYLALADLTIGYGKARDTVSLGQIAERTGIKRQHVVRALHHLEAVGLAGHAPTKGQSLTRWAVWPAPAVPKAGTAPDTGNRSVPKAGNRTVPKGVPKAGTHQDSKKEEASKKGASGKPTPSDQQQVLLPDDQPKPSRKVKPKQADPRVAEFIAWFAKEFERQAGRKYIVAGGKDGSTVKRLLSSLSIEDLQRATAGMFSDSWGRSSASIGLLSSQINKWLAGPCSNSRANVPPFGSPADEPAYFRPAAEVLPQ